MLKRLFWWHLGHPLQICLMHLPDSKHYALKFQSNSHMKSVITVLHMANVDQINRRCMMRSFWPNTIFKSLSKLSCLDLKPNKCYPLLMKNIIFKCQKIDLSNMALKHVPPYTAGVILTPRNALCDAVLQCCRVTNQMITHCISIKRWPLIAYRMQIRMAQRTFTTPKMIQTKD